jgi:hypothetical protein
MNTYSAWFDVDKEGLQKLVRRKGMAFVAYELVQNCLDTGAKKVDVKLIPIPNMPKATLSVFDDDPDGFKNLSHAYTLFAESEKKADPTKRGRFNLGEKLVLAACEEARITSTKGSVIFGTMGRHRKKERQERGTTFHGVLRMTREELEEVLTALNLIIPPDTCEVFVNGEKLIARQPLSSFSATLPTEIADEDGYLKRSERKTLVQVYDRLGDRGHLYEMGIPVVEIDLPWDVDIAQKIPLNTDRDNVTPVTHKAICVAVVNAMHKMLKPEEATIVGVQEALSDRRVEVEAVQTILTHQHGNQRVVLDPRDPEANAKAFQHGFTVIRGSAYSKEQWEQIRRAEAAPPSTQLFPTQQVYSDDPDAPVARIIPEEKWTPGMATIAKYATELAWRTIHKSISVRFETRFGAIDAANYGGQSLCFNVSRLGYAWFDQGITVQVNDLLIHELAHDGGNSHLTKEFDSALSRIGAEMVNLALTEPAFFLRSKDS